MPFIGMLEAESDFAEHAEEILRSKDNHSLIVLDSGPLVAAGSPGCSL